MEPMVVLDDVNGTSRVMVTSSVAEFSSVVVTSSVAMHSLVLCDALWLCHILSLFLLALSLFCLLLCPNICF